MMIDRFIGQYAFLSNFSPHPLILEGDKIVYPTAEHAFQAQKTLDKNLQVTIAEASTPRQAKTLGRALDLRKDWEWVKFDIMRRVVHHKFVSNEELLLQLTNTAPLHLLEGNNWHDQLWGDCYCAKHCATSGLNALGTILMDLRLDCLAYGYLDPRFSLSHSSANCS